MPITALYTDDRHTDRRQSDRQTHGRAIAMIYSEANVNSQT